MSNNLRRSYTRKEILATYARHPLRERTILERIRKNRGSLDDLSETDLASDPSGALTDQNHIGGVDFVRQLALRAGVNAETRVLDLGSGLGGSARTLASRFGCRVHGVELSPTRCREARRLTKLVGLTASVSFECGTFSTARVKKHYFDVLWNQSSWVHVQHLSAFVRRWHLALRPGGKFAMEDTYLVRSPSTQAERFRLYRLENNWRSHLYKVSDWQRALGEVGFGLTTNETHTAAFLDHFAHLQANGEQVNANERQSWQDAIDLADAGIVSYRRLIAA